MASFAGVSVDAEGAVHDWLNSLTTTLVGETRPVTLGFHYDLLRSPGRGAYGLISRIGGNDGITPETPADMARISVSFFSTTKKTAAAAAVAYANTLRGLSAAPYVSAAYGVTLRLADNLTGPTWIPNLLKQLPQYLVDADIYLTQN